MEGKEQRTRNDLLENEDEIYRFSLLHECLVAENNAGRICKYWMTI